MPGAYGQPSKEKIMADNEIKYRIISLEQKLADLELKHSQHREYVKFGFEQIMDEAMKTLYTVLAKYLEKMADREIGKKKNDSKNKT